MSPESEQALADLDLVKKHSAGQSAELRTFMFAFLQLRAFFRDSPEFLDMPSEQALTEFMSRARGEVAE